MIECVYELYYFYFFLFVEEEVKVLTLGVKMILYRKVGATRGLYSQMEMNLVCSSGIYRQIREYEKRTRSVDLESVELGIVEYGRVYSNVSTHERRFVCIPFFLLFCDPVLHSSC